jgi:hypothetical protein
MRSLQEYCKLSIDSRLEPGVLCGQQVGLVVGKHAVGSRDLLLAAVPVVADDVVRATATTSKSLLTNASGKKGGTQPAASALVPAAAVTSLQLDGDVCADQAAQLARVLPGGKRGAAEGPLWAKRHNVKLTKR